MAFGNPPFPVACTGCGIPVGLLDITRLLSCQREVLVKENAAEKAK